MTHLKAISLVCLLSLFLITGCSSKYDVNITEVFRSNILANDTKMFTYSIVFVNKSKLPNNTDDRQQKDKANKKRGNNGKPQQAGSSEREKFQKQLTEELESRLVDKLEENGYCRKGFFELSRTFNKSIYTLNGECNESATPDDRKNFP